MEKEQSNKFSKKVHREIGNWSLFPDTLLQLSILHNITCHWFTRVPAIEYTAVLHEKADKNTCDRECVVLDKDHCLFTLQEPGSNQISGENNLLPKKSLFRS